MNKNLTTTNQNSKLALTKAKSLLDITNKLLSKKDSNQLMQSFKFKPFIRENEHSTNVTSVAISPDGNKIVSGATNNTIKIWDIESGKCLNTLEGHIGDVYSVAISPDGKKIFSGSGDQTIKIWDIESGKCLNTLKGHSSLVSLITVSSNGKFIVSGSWDKTIKVWDINSAECINTLRGHTDGVKSIVICPDDKTIVSGSWDKTIKVWDMESTECINTLIGHTDFIISVTVSHDGKKIVSGSKDETIKIWDIQSGECTNTLKGYSGTVMSVIIRQDGKHIISGGMHGYIKIWDIQSSECLYTLKEHSYDVYSIAISTDEKYIISGSMDGFIKVWDIQSGECIYTIDYAIEVSIDKNGYFVGDIKDIIEYVRVSETPNSERKLTDEEINYFAIDNFFTKKMSNTFENDKRLIDYVEKVTNSEYGFFMNIWEDLAIYLATKSKEKEPMLIMACAYAQRLVVAALCMQGLFGKKEFDEIYNLFLSTQQMVSKAMSQSEYEDTVKFQNGAGEQALELIKSYDSRFNDKIIFSILKLMQENPSKAHDTGKFFSVDEVFEHFDV